MFSRISRLPAIYCNIASKPKTSNPNIFFCVSSISERNISLITLCKCGKHRLKIGRLVISKNKVDFFKNVHVLAHSAVCLDEMMPPRQIWMCRNGPFLCGECKARVDRKCPSCQSRGKFRRNIALEKVIVKLFE